MKEMKPSEWRQDGAKLGSSLLGKSVIKKRSLRDRESYPCSQTRSVCTRKDIGHTGFGPICDFRQPPGGSGTYPLS
ncbi:uncharacterized protein LOC118549992 isoform X2 [Halichoerus grypus]